MLYEVITDSGTWRVLQTGRALLGAGFAIVLTIGAIRIAGFGVFDDFQQRVGAVVVASLVVLPGSSRPYTLAPK